MTLKDNNTENYRKPNAKNMKGMFHFFFSQKKYKQTVRLYEKNCVEMLVYSEKKV